MVIYFVFNYFILEGFSGALVVKNLLADVGDTGFLLGSERSPGEGNGSQLQYSCLGNPMDREACKATFHRLSKESNTIERLNNKETTKFH